MNIISKLGLLICFFGIPFAHAHAQRIWTLNECIQYAIENNIDIQRRIVQLRKQEIQLNTSKYARLPKVDAEVGEQFSFGNYNSYTGTMQTDDGSYNNDLAFSSANISASLPIFDGFKIKNQIKADKFLLEAATADLAQARKDISIQISTYYLQTLYYKNLVKVAENQVQTSQKMVEKATVLVEEGKTPLSEKAEAEAKLAADESELTDAEGQATLARLTLAQLLNLPSIDDFEVTEVEEIVEELPLAQTIYENAVENYASVVAAKAKINANTHLVETARSGFFPTLSFEGNFSTFYVNMFHQPSMGAFGKQLNNNMNEVVGLHLRIPLFNRLETRNRLRQAKQDLMDANLALDNARLALQKEIQTAYYNATVAEKKHASAIKAMDAAQISLGFEESKYEEGRSSVFKLYESQQQFVKAQQEAVQAKYERMIRQRILKFYQEQ